ncbi:thiosulfate sulfurtransferase 16, chloroplastic-like [Panicum miliaceum]|uniref:Thiosulfate sulfurtransferase 16, chloroplastic-like n=1 Tax=Panicum miliaceum TaxID=4540 RepID=A0A3L6S2K9_PANMI|nr:thiosulfate sulfurtransferase 16, chloroplastic-like [Panicum miliaceum]
MAATLARVSLRALARPRHSAAGVPLQLDATAIARKTPGSLIGVRGTGTGTGADGALQADEEAVVPRSVPVHIAYELQKAGHRYLDVRTESEFRAGHPERAVNIPYVFRTNDSGTTKNTHFLEQVSRIFGKDDEILVGCQSGRRPLMAATELHSAGFTDVTDIAGGFSSWREKGLPISH